MHFVLQSTALMALNSVLQYTPLGCIENFPDLFLLLLQLSVRSKLKNGVNIAILSEIVACRRLDFSSALCEEVEGNQRKKAGKCSILWPSSLRNMKRQLIIGQGSATDNSTPGTQFQISKDPKEVIPIHVTALFL